MMGADTHASRPTQAATLMVQGTASGVGKSALVAALCRLLRRQGLRVAPFKAQNMSNNAAVCADGGEIGRAQAAQAEAAGVAPSVDMNPILLKPEGDARSQVVVRGRVWQRLTAREYHVRKPELLQVVAESLARLRASHDVVVIEGAGSPAEINLRDGDLVNMAVARLADAPVLLAADIDRGGVFAALVGTLELLEPADRARVAGLLINRFRGDPALLTPGLRFLEERTGCPVLGVVPYLHDLRLPAEDSLSLDGRSASEGRRGAAGRGDGASAAGDGPRVQVAVICFPRIANFDDFGPLEAEPGVRLQYVRAPADLGVPDLVILPGSKSTLADLAWLRASGLGAALLRLHAAGVPILGICGGFQMLGTSLADPDGVEGEPGERAGLGLLPARTVFVADKSTRQVCGEVAVETGVFGCLAGLSLSGYEIHLGRTTVAAPPFARVGPTPPAPLPLREGGASAAGRLPPPFPDREGGPGGLGLTPDGAVSPDGLVAGTYVHGLFHNDAIRRRLVGALARRRGIVLRNGAPHADPYDRLADAVAAHVDLARLFALCRLPVGGRR
ncbi:MAG TPA: cobyric acid synthase [Chloroflexota bacterium]|nr:cobyric acid synthase [Chloroflexota bacterium]